MFRFVELLILFQAEQADLEPPIIKPLDANTFDNDAPPPGEEELLVPPFIAAPDSTDEKDENASENQAAGIVGIMHPFEFF